MSRRTRNVSRRAAPQPQRTTPQLPQPRPQGITITAILLGIQSMIFLLVGIISISGASANGKIVAVLAIAGIISLVFGISAYFLCRGLLALRRWAFWGTLILQGLSLVGGLLELTQANASIGSMVSSFVLPVVVLLYFLVDRNVRTAFRT